MDKDTADWLQALIGAIAAVAGLYAAAAAKKSAGAAQDALRIADQAQKRGLRAQLVILSGEVLTESELVKSMIETLKIEYSSLFAFSGSTQHSSHRLLKEKLEEKGVLIESITSRASALIDKFKLLSDASDEDITNQSLDLQKNLLDIKRHRVELELELAQVIQQNRDYRQRALGK